MFWFLILCVGFAFCVFLVVRNGIVLRNHMKIMTAIDKYVAHTGDLTGGNRMLFNMENYSSTFRRYFDFSYKRIVSPEHLEKLMPYL